MDDTPGEAVAGKVGAPAPGPGVPRIAWATRRTQVRCRPNFLVPEWVAEGDTSIRRGN